MLCFGQRGWAPDATEPERTEFLQMAESPLTGVTPQPEAGSLGCFEQVGVTTTFRWRASEGSLNELEVRLCLWALGALLGTIGVLGNLESIEVLIPTVGRGRDAELS